jgi:hypothetical protein
MWVGVDGGAKHDNGTVDIVVLVAAKRYDGSSGGPARGQRGAESCKQAAEPYCAIVDGTDAGDGKLGAWRRWRVRPRLHRTQRLHGLSPSTTHADTRAVAVGMQRHIIVDRSGSPQHTPQPLRALARHKRRTDLDGREP